MIVLIVLVVWIAIGCLWTAVRAAQLIGKGNGRMWWFEYIIMLPFAICFMLLDMALMRFTGRHFRNYDDYED